MQTRTLYSIYRAAALVTAVTTAGLTGCSAFNATVAVAPVVPHGVALQGAVHGGQQPVSGASIQVYAASTSGYSAASYTLLTQTVTTNAGGAFGITGDYTCPSANSMIYIVATGGNSGGGTNANLSLMAAAGPCGSLAGSTFISINEVTTVASVVALAPFMTSIANVATSPTNVTGMTNAFLAVNELANLVTGSAGGTVPTGAVVPTSELNTLGDILAACVNSTGGTSGDGSSCGTLFAAATPTSGTAPTETIGAMLNIAKNPGKNVTTLLGLVSGSAPFQPTLSSATDFTVSIKYKPTLSTPSASAIDTNGNVWMTNATSNTVAVVDSTGTPVTGSPYSGGGLNTPSGVAIDGAGNAWITDKGSSALSVFTPAGVGTLSTATTLSTPTAVAIDGQGILWITNGGNSSVSGVVISGTTVSSSTAYTAGGISGPVAVAINPF